MELRAPRGRRSVPAFARGYDSDVAAINHFILEVIDVCLLFRWSRPLTFIASIDPKARAELFLMLRRTVRVCGTKRDSLGFRGYRRGFRCSPPTARSRYLALTKAHYDNIRANITYSRLDSRGRGQLAAELPLLYTAGRWPTLPPCKHKLGFS
jgi:hypothetical protein